MTTMITFVRGRISSVPFCSAFRGICRRILWILGRPATAGATAAFIALGATAYVVMLLMSFGLGLRLRDAALVQKKENETLRRMEAQAREQEARFVERHRQFLEIMQEITALKYLTPENASLSEARGDTFLRQ